MNPRSATLKEVIWVRVTRDDRAGKLTHGLQGCVARPTSGVGYGYTFDEARDRALRAMDSEARRQVVISEEDMALLRKGVTIQEIATRFLSRISLPTRQSGPVHVEQSEPVAPSLLRDLANIEAGLGVALVKRILTRMKRGWEEYGVMLHTFNGRDPLMDLEEELLDALQYARQASMEARTPKEHEYIMGVVDLYTMTLKYVVTQGNPDLVQDHDTEDATPKD